MMDLLAWGAVGSMLVALVYVGVVVYGKRRQP